jgi:hypothetical protein
VRKSQDCGNIQKPACTVSPVWTLPVILRIEFGHVKGRKRRRQSKRWFCVKYWYQTLVLYHSCDNAQHTHIKYIFTLYWGVVGNLEILIVPIEKNNFLFRIVVCFLLSWLVTWIIFSFRESSILIGSLIVKLTNQTFQCRFVYGIGKWWKLSRRDKINFIFNPDFIRFAWCMYSLHSDLLHFSVLSLIFYLFHVSFFWLLCTNCRKLCSNKFVHAAELG